MPKISSKERAELAHTDIEEGKIMNKFLIGLSVGMLAGVATIAYSKDMQKVVEKTKNKLTDKIKSL